MKTVAVDEAGAEVFEEAAGLEEAGAEAGGGFGCRDG